MGSATTVPRLPLPPGGGRCGALAYVAAPTDATAVRRRRAARIAAVLAEFGYRTYLAPAGHEIGIHADRLARVVEADLVVCDLVRPDRDIPVEVAIAATRRIPVLALVPADVSVEGCAAQLLVECGATVMRYARAEPHHVLHARLGELEPSASGDQG
ncbi:MAG TPA: hypothetical protein VHF89_08640 [Solirubrobacteraceae bacterium]|nr:hypothetical protein [Solirubrobacteraceae bacterium]